MASGFPGSIDNFADPLANSPLNSPSHATLHSDVNDAVEKIETYMGLVKVIPTGATNATVDATGTVTIGNAVSSVTVSGAFSSLYDNYQILISGGVGSTNIILSMRLGSSTTGYYQARNGLNYATSARGDGVTNNGSEWTVMAYANTSTIYGYITLNGPFLAKHTSGTASYTNLDAGLLVFAEHRVATSYSAFTLTCNTGTITGGTIRIYGYRN